MAKTSQTVISKRSEQRRRFYECFLFAKKLSVVFLINIALISAVVIYLLMGGMLFNAVESENEQYVHQTVTSKRKSCLSRLWNITNNADILSATWTQKAEQIFLIYEDAMFRGYFRGWDGEINETLNNWSFSGSVVFSATVITTIGYGLIAPKTGLGQLMTMLYALFGIPLFVLCISSVGKAMAQSFTLFWKVHRTKIPATSIRSKLPFCGFGRQKECRKKWRERVAEEEARENEDEVPVLVCLLLVVLYILLGGLMFHIWESEWSYLESSYFCFITLSTIGFGDYFPTKSVSELQGSVKNCCILAYFTFGLALLSMTFQLIQGRVKYVCQKVAVCLTIQGKC